MITSAGDLFPGRAGNLDWRGFIGRRPIAQLTRVIISPCPESAIGLERDGVPPSAGDLLPGRAGNLDWPGFINSSPIAQLTSGIISPCPESAIGLER